MVCCENNSILWWVVLIVVILLILLFVWSINEIAKRNTPVGNRYDFTFKNLSSDASDLSVTDSRTGFVYIEGPVSKNEIITIKNPEVPVNINFVNKVDDVYSIYLTNFAHVGNAVFTIEDSHKSITNTTTQTVTCIKTDPNYQNVHVKITSVIFTNSASSSVNYKIGGFGENQFSSSTSGSVGAKTTTSNLLTSADQILEVDYYNTKSCILEDKNVYYNNACYNSDSIVGQVPVILAFEINSSTSIKFYVTKPEVTVTWDGTTLTGVSTCPA